jgi:hypothetical protein
VANKKFCYKNVARLSAMRTNMQFGTVWGRRLGVTVRKRSDRIKEMRQLGIDEGGNDYEDKQDSFHFVCGSSLLFSARHS